MNENLYMLIFQGLFALLELRQVAKFYSCQKIFKYSMDELENEFLNLLFQCLKNEGKINVDFALIYTVFIRFACNSRFWFEMNNTLYDILLLNVPIFFCNIIFSHRSKTENISDKINNSV